MKRVWISLLGAALLMGSAAAAFTAGPGGAVSTPSLVFVKNSNRGLVDGSVVSFAGQGFTPGSQVVVRECGIDGFPSFACIAEGPQTRTIKVGKDGTFSGSLAVVHLVGSVDCRTVNPTIFQAGCFIQAVSQTVPGEQARDDPYAVWPGLYWGWLTAKPVGGMQDGSLVHVHGEGWVPGETVYVNECVNGDAGPGFCGRIVTGPPPSPDFIPVIGPVGSFGDPTTASSTGTVDVDVHVKQNPTITPPPGGTLTIADCTENGKPPMEPPTYAGGDQCFLVAHQGAHSWSNQVLLIFRQSGR